MTFRAVRTFILLTFAGAALSAHADLIDFENVPGTSPGNLTTLPNGYAGYNWDGLDVFGRQYVENNGPKVYGPSASYLDAMHGDYAAYNTEGSVVTISTGIGTVPITSMGVTFNSLGEFPFLMRIHASNADGSSDFYSLTANDYHTIYFHNAINIQMVAIITLHPGYDSSPRRFGIDDLAINTAPPAVPAPAAALPFLAGALARSRKRRR